MAAVVRLRILLIVSGSCIFLLYSFIAWFGLASAVAIERFAIEVLTRSLILSISSSPIGFFEAFQIGRTGDMKFYFIV